MCGIPLESESARDASACAGYLWKAKVGQGCIRMCGIPLATIEGLRAPGMHPHVRDTSGASPDLQITCARDASACAGYLWRESADHPPSTSAQRSAWAHPERGRSKLEGPRPFEAVVRGGVHLRWRTLIISPRSLPPPSMLRPNSIARCRVRRVQARESADRVKVPITGLASHFLSLHLLVILISSLTSAFLILRASAPHPRWSGASAPTARRARVVARGGPPPRRVRAQHCSPPASLAGTPAAWIPVMALPFMPRVPEFKSTSRPLQ